MIIKQEYMKIYVNANIENIMDIAYLNIFYKIDKQVINIVKYINQINQIN
jgi:hypothetical protein